MEIVAKCSNCNCDFEVDEQGYIYCPQCGIKSSEPLTQKPKYTIPKESEKKASSKSGAKKSTKKETETKGTSSKKKTTAKTSKKETANPNFEPTGNPDLDNRLSIAYKYLEEKKYFNAKGICETILAQYPEDIHANSIMAKILRMDFDQTIAQNHIAFASQTNKLENCYYYVVKNAPKGSKVLHEMNPSSDSFLVEKVKNYYKYKTYKVDSLEANIYNKKAHNVYIDNPIITTKTVKRYKQPLPDGSTEQNLVTVTDNREILEDTLIGYKKIQNTKKEEPQFSTRSDLLGDTNPFTFPAASQSKFVKIAFWVLTFFVAIYGMALYTIFVNHNFIGADVWAKTTTAELVNVVGGGFFIIAGWLFWMIYFFVRLFKREDITQPTAIPRIRLGAVIALIISLICTVWRIGVVTVATMLPDELPNINIATEKVVIIVSAVIFVVSVILLLVLGVVDRTRFKFNMQPKLVVNMRIILLGILHTLESLALIVVAFSGLITLINAIKPDLIGLVFDTSATTVVSIAKTALIASASTFGASLILDIVLTNLRPPKKREKLELYDTPTGSIQDIEEIIEDNDEYVLVKIKSAEQTLVKRKEALKYLAEERAKIQNSLNNFLSGKVNIVEFFTAEKCVLENVPEELYNNILNCAKAERPE